MLQRTRSFLRRSVATEPALAAALVGFGTCQTLGVRQHPYQAAGGRAAQERTGFARKRVDAGRPTPPVFSTSESIIVEFVEVSRATAELLLPKRQKDTKRRVSPPTPLLYLFFSQPSIEREMDLSFFLDKDNSEIVGEIRDAIGIYIVSQKELPKRFDSVTRNGAAGTKEHATLRLVAPLPEALADGVLLLRRRDHSGTRVVLPEFMGGVRWWAVSVFYPRKIPNPFLHLVSGTGNYESRTTEAAAQSAAARM